MPSKNPAVRSGVDRVSRRPLQIGGVLNGQNVFVKHRGIVVLLHSGVLGSADLLHAVLFGRAKGSSRGL